VRKGRDAGGKNAVSSGAGIIRLLCGLVLGTCGGVAVPPFVTHPRFAVWLGQLDDGILTPGSKRAWKFGSVSLHVGRLTGQEELPRRSGKDS
jgi:hypothetical protein